MGLKPKILYVEDNIDMREVISFIVKSLYQCDIVEAKSGAEAIAILAKNIDFNLIISDYQMPDGSGVDVYNYIKKVRLKIPFIILTATKDQARSVLSDEVRIYEKPLPIDELLAAVKENIKLTEHIYQDTYLPVAITLLKKMKDIYGSLYVKLSETKYVKVYQEGQPVFTEVFDKYQSRGTNFLYINNQEFENFISKYRKDVFSKAVWDDLDDYESDSSFKLNTELLRHLGSHLKMSKDLMEITRAHVEMGLKIAAKNKNFQQVIQKFRVVENMSFADHCLFIVYVAGFIIKSINPSGLNHNLQIISLATILHDASLSDRLYDLKLKLLYASKLRDLEKGGSEQIEIFQHPMKAADLSREFDFCHPEVEFVLSQHHELPDGSGFPMGLKSEHIHPLSSLFIVAEDFVDFFMRFHPKPDWKAYLESRRVMFRSQNFYDAFAVLNGSLTKATE